LEIRGPLNVTTRWRGVACDGQLRRLVYAVKGQRDFGGRMGMHSCIHSVAERLEKGMAVSEV